MAKQKTLTATFTLDRETKNKHRFNEDGNKAGHIVGSLYVDKKAVEKLGGPNEVKVTIEPIE